MKISTLGLIAAAGAMLLWSGGDWKRALAAGPAQEVRTPAQLAAAIERATGGETIRLAPGNYGIVSIRNRRYSAPVTFQGPKSGARAQLEALRVTGSRGVRVEQLAIGAALPISDGAYARIQNSQDVVIAASHIHGSLDGNPRNDGPGLHIVSSTNVHFDGSEISDAQIGVMMSKSDRVRVTNNHIHMIRSDGIVAAAGDGLEFSGNYITDFRPNPKDHSDGIQLLSTGMTRGMNDIKIVDNVIMQGPGERLQGIWINNGKEHPFRNVVIHNNLIYINDYYNGIGINNTFGAQVTNNTVVSDPTDKLTAWIRIRNSSDIRLENNVSDFLIIGDAVTGLTNTGNLFFKVKTPPGCMFKKLDARAAAQVSDLVVQGVGFQQNATIHPSLRGAPRAAVLTRAAAVRQCRGSFAK